MPGTRLAVGPGTGVLEDVRVGPVVVSPARKAYSRVLALAEESEVFPMHRAGLGHLDDTYLRQEEQWLKYANGQRIDLAMHSQNCLHGLLFLIRHRLLVRRAIFINPPFGGATVAERFRGLACADDMAPGSPYIKQFRGEIELGFRRFRQGMRRNPNYHVPECHFIGLKHDRVVNYWSPHWRLGGLVHNHSLGRGPCPPVEPWIQWHEFSDDPNHINVIRHRDSLQLFGEILQNTGAWIPQPRREPVGGGVLAKAA